MLFTDVWGNNQNIRNGPIVLLLGHKLQYVFYVDQSAIGRHPSETEKTLQHPQKHRKFIGDNSMWVRLICNTSENLFYFAPILVTPAEKNKYKTVRLPAAGQRKSMLWSLIELIII